LAAQENNVDLHWPPPAAPMRGSRPCKDAVHWLRHSSGGDCEYEWEQRRLSRRPVSETLLRKSRPTTGTMISKRGDYYNGIDPRLINR
jgi:hypothetical protein